MDGVETTIVADPDVAHELIANQGKLYFADWVVADNASIRYGVLEDISLVNEKVDYDGRVFDETFANYLNPDMDDNFNYVNGTLVVSNNLSYNVGSTVEVIYTNETYTMNLADVVKAMKDGSANYGLWVVGDRFNNTYTVYAGTELSADATIDVATDDVKSDVSDATYDAGTNTYTVTVTIPLNADNDAQTTDITVTSNATQEKFNDARGNTLIEYNNEIYEGSLTIKDIGASKAPITFTVYSEGGDVIANYIINVVNAHNDIRANTVVKLWQTSTNKTVSQNDTAYTSVAAAVEAGMNEADVRATTGLVAQLDSDALQVQYAIYSNTAKAEQGTDADYSTAMRTGDYIDVSRLADGNVLVLKITKTDGSEVWLNDYNANGCTAKAVYVVYEIQK